METIDRPSSTIETQTAQLDTLSVTIKALHVNGKQMTLAVFRQLPCRDSNDRSGEHWGYVRYHIKDEGVLWLVSSRDGILVRSRMKLTPDWGITSEPNTLRRELDKQYANRAQNKNVIDGEWKMKRQSETENKISYLQDALIDAETKKNEELARVADDKRIMINYPQLFIAV